MSAEATIKAFIDGILKREGVEFTNRDSDAGGPTKYGIIQKTLSEYLGRSATIEEVQNLTEEEARKIYRFLYVEKYGFHLLIPVSERIAEEVIDTGVNCGQGTAAEWFERCLNVLNYQEQFYPDVTPNGKVSQDDVDALAAYVKKRGAEGETILLRALNGLQTVHYIRLAEKRKFDEKNIYGWLRNRIV